MFFFLLMSLRCYNFIEGLLVTTTLTDIKELFTYCYFGGHVFVQLTFEAVVVELTDYVN